MTDDEEEIIKIMEKAAVLVKIMKNDQKNCSADEIQGILPSEISRLTQIMISTLFQQPTDHFQSHSDIL